MSTNTDLHWKPVAAAAAAAAAAIYAAYAALAAQRARDQLSALPPPAAGVDELIGNTPLVRIRSLSRATGRDVYAKLELANPGGSAKDRVALGIVRRAEQLGQLRPGHADVVFEGTSGSTGISIATICNALGYRAHISLPDDTSQEKVALLESLGAYVNKVRPAGIVDPNQYVNAARAACDELNARGCGDARGDASDGVTVRGVFADQFENEANWRVHYDHTGPEIWRQTRGRVDAFVAGCGTGGTIAGVARFLKEKRGKRGVRVVLADPQGSGFYNRVRHGVMYDRTEREGTRRRHQVDTIVEGVGLNRITRNFSRGEPYIDDAVRVSDAQAVKMAKFLSVNDGLFVGSSTAINAVAAVQVARTLPAGALVVIIACDSGARHLSKFWKEAVAVDRDVTLAEIMGEE
ncbi:LAFE_0D02168g1_1 [Lachancea fermentati]|uniref:cysteine synthase n=1 Tax=Lachancea fermentati TaxID=4955 RepID=A0A1G4MB18_LACFM|nr:LAFE_0D02168g1_1 [Lachancea fermentati]